MPTYVYRCRDCGRQFEHFEKMTSRVRTRKCPACGGRCERQISGGAGFLFKGEGFYITDYRSEEYRSKHKAESEKAAPAGDSAAERCCVSACAISFDWPMWWKPPVPFPIWHRCLSMPPIALWITIYGLGTVFRCIRIVRDDWWKQASLSLQWGSWADTNSITVPM